MISKSWAYRLEQWRKHPEKREEYLKKSRIQKRKSSRKRYKERKNDPEFMQKKRDASNSYRKKYPDKIKASQKKYREENKEKIAKNREKRKQNKEYHVKYRKEHLEESRIYARKRYANDIQFKLKRRIRSRLYDALSGRIKSGSAVSDLGCTIQELKIHLENQFEEGMTWDNWKHDGWHIDHIKPLSSFDLTDREQFLEAWHYTNLQPLWWWQNTSKGAKINWRPNSND
tara:strand:+ start:43 stop:729 length:687 start_codon:yes stop_codon:yes gene_type:complete